MRDAYKKAVQVVNQLKRQRDEWLEEQGNDQAELKKLFEQKDEIEARIEAKYAEISGENLNQILQYNQLIREAEASRDKLLA